MFAGKPVIGIVGGIGSGKSFVADLFGEQGCLVTKADELVAQVYARPEIRRILEQWWGQQAFTVSGEVNRKWIAGRVFADPGELKMLESVIHPAVSQLRDGLMNDHARDAAILAFVWDTPLLFEVGHDQQCDAVVFVETPLEVRQRRVLEARGWDSEELLRRENMQMALDKKRLLAHYMVVNTADAAFARRQVGTVLSRVLKRD